MAKEGIIGKIDGFADGFLRGWVFDLSHPRRRQCVDVFVGEAFVGQAACGFHRTDLEALGFGDGRHEFLFELDGAGIEPADIHLRVSMAPHTVLRLDSANAEETPRQPPDAARKAYFEALLAGLAFGGRAPAPARSTHPLLVESAPLHGIPLSRFAIHIARKFGRDIADEPALRAFLAFYLETYSPFKAPWKVPLAPDESRFWSAPESQACRAADRFAPPPTWQSPADRIFAWTVHDATRLNVEDAWIDDKLVAYLQADPMFARSRDFPINRFLRRFLEQNAALDGLRWKEVGDRQVAYAAVALHAVHAPHLLKLLPSEWLARFVAPGDDGDSPLDHAVRRIVGDAPGLGGLADRVVRAPAPCTAVATTTDAAVDVQLVGPFDRVLGLSESCRRFAEAVRACGHRVAFANYDIGSASPREAQSAIPDTLAKARINILHLNLEEIPEALAFALAPLAGTYLIAIPYFELSAVARCHALGLRMIDEIWTPSRFLQDLFASHGPATHLMPLPVRPAAEPGRAAARAHVLDMLGPEVPEPVTVYLATADALSWIGRKHTIGVLDAFQAAFSRDEPVRLIVKIHNIANMTNATQVGIWDELAARAARDPRIVLVTKTIPAARYRQLLTGVDCLVSLHRSEGLGLDILDAMALGTAVVATAYSGNVDVCDATTSWPVAFDLVPVGVGNYPFAEPGHVWAEPRLDSAVAALRDVHERPEDRAARTARARARIGAHNDLQAAAARIGARLAAILATL